MAIRQRSWFARHPDAAPIALGVAFWLMAAIPLVTPIRLVAVGVPTEGVVTDVKREQIPSRSGRRAGTQETATIRYNNGTRDFSLERAWNPNKGRFFGICLDGCYRMGERLQIRYLVSDPSKAMIGSVWLQVVGQIPMFVIGAAFFGWVWMGKVRRPAMTSIDAAAIARKSQAKREAKELARKLKADGKRVS